MSELVKAIIKVINEVDNVEKNSNVGTGQSAYKGVSDKDVKLAVRRAMARNGLVILPIGVTANTDVMAWQEADPYNPGKTKRKQQVFVDVHVKYKLMHTSGESEIVEGVGHGVDSMDKAAGKATTYALKYTLLYLFLIPSGEIDDADRNHSDEAAVPPSNAGKVVDSKDQVKKEDVKPKEPESQAAVVKPEEVKKEEKPATTPPPVPATVANKDPEGKDVPILNEARFNAILVRVKNGEAGVIPNAQKAFTISESQLAALRAAIPTLDKVEGTQGPVGKPKMNDKPFRDMLKKFKAGNKEAYIEAQNAFALDATQLHKIKQIKLGIYGEREEAEGDGASAGTDGSTGN